jgi:pyruvate dehydrogenase (quinone)
MGAAVPYAISAKFAHPSRPVVALVGDGAMQMNNMAELITVQRYWRRWADPRLVVCVLNNEDLSEVTWDSGQPKAIRGMRLPGSAECSVCEIRRHAGAEGHLRRCPEHLEAAWRDALAADRPVVVEVKTDANVPPLPPHITAEQIKAFRAAFMKGDRPLAGVMAKSLKRAIQETA